MSNQTTSRRALCLACSWTCTGFGTDRAAQRHTEDFPGHEVHHELDNRIHTYWRGRRLR